MDFAKDYSMNCKFGITVGCSKQTETYRTYRRFVALWIPQILMNQRPERCQDLGVLSLKLDVASLQWVNFQIVELLVKDSLAAFARSMDYVAIAITAHAVKHQHVLGPV